ncbi:MAG: GEVED domain-containing protein [Streptococcus salivarius]
MGKDLFNDRISRFSIRKLNVGVCSVLLGTLVMVGTASQVSADETANQVQAGDVASTTATVSDETSSQNAVAAQASTEVANFLSISETNSQSQTVSNASAATSETSTTQASSETTSQAASSTSASTAASTTSVAGSTSVGNTTGVSTTASVTSASSETPASETASEAQGVDVQAEASTTNALSSGAEASAVVQPVVTAETSGRRRTRRALGDANDPNLIGDDVEDATSTPKVEKPGFTTNVDAKSMASQISWLDFGDVANWTGTTTVLVPKSEVKPTENLEEKLALQVGSTYTKEIMPGYVVTVKVKSLKPFQATEIYKKRMENQGATEAEKATYDPNAKNGYVSGVTSNAAKQAFNNGEEAKIVADAQNNWTEIRFENIDTKTKKTTISSALNGGNIGVQFEISATFRGKTVKPAIVMADGESANPGELVMFTTNGEGWQHIGEWKKFTRPSTSVTYSPQDTENLFGPNPKFNNTNLNQLRRSTQVGPEKKPVAWKYFGNPDQVTGGLGTGIFGPNISEGNYTVPIVMTRGASEVGLYVASGGKQSAMLGFFPIDEGDAPESYGKAMHTIATVDGITGAKVNQPYIGNVSPDMDENTVLDWFGDDKATTADEGIDQLLPDELKGSTNEMIKMDRTRPGNYKLSVEAHTDGASEAHIYGWVDFNQNGKFDEDERSNLATITQDGTVELTFANSKTYIDPSVKELGARVRIAKKATEIESPTGMAFSGEVEDFRTQITHPPKGEFKETSGPQGAKQTATVTFTARGEHKYELNSSAVIDETVEPYIVDKDGNRATLDADGYYVVPGQGKYKITANGKDVDVEFIPEDNFLGTADGISIRRSDNNGYDTGWSTKFPDQEPNINGQLNTMDGQYVPTVTPIEIEGVDKTSTDVQGATQKETPTFNTTETNSNGDKIAITPSAEYPAKLVDPATGLTTDAPSVTVEGEGTYTINPSTGEVTFTPDPSFTGTAKGVEVTLSAPVGRNKDGKIQQDYIKTATAKYTPTVTPITVTPTDKVSADVQNVPQTQTPTFDLSNDKTAEITSKKLVDPATGQPTDETTVTVAGEGSYTIDPTTGAVTFTPEKDFVGTAKGVTVQATATITNANGKTATITSDATYTPTVVPAVPTANPATSKDIQGATQTGTPTFAGTTVQVNGEDKAITIKDNSYTLLDNDGNEVTSTPAYAADGTTEIGTYSIDSATGQVTFTPTDKSYTGVVTPAKVQAESSNGIKVDTTYTPEIVPVTPTATPAETKDIQGATQTGKPEFKGGTVTVDGVEKTVAINEDVPATFDDGSTTKTVDGVGTYTVAADGTVTFVPEKSFVGTAPAVTVVREDKNGTKASATYTPTVTPVTPTATPVETTDIQGATQTGKPVFTEGDSRVPMNDDVPATFDDGSTTKTIDGVGTYTVAADGTVTFVPEKSFVGTAPAVTVVREDKNGTKASATYTPTVTPVTPTAEDTTSTDKQGQTQTGTPTFTPGNPNVPMDDDTPATFEDGSTTKTVPGEGTYTVAPDGTVTFVPEKSFTGEGTGVTVKRVDKNGTPVTAKYTPTVTPVTPTATPAESEAPQGVVQTGTVTFTEGDPVAPIDKDTITLLDENGQPVASVEAKSPAGDVIGTFTVDKETGVVTFTPTDKSYSGDVVPVKVQAADTNGTTVETTYTPKITPVVPTAELATSTDIQGKTQTGTPSFTPGNPAIPMDDDVPATFEDGSTTKVIPGEGTYTVVPDGTVTFVPEKAFTGEGTGVTVKRVDKNGTPATAKYTPTVTPVTPTAEDTTSTGKQGQTQTGKPEFTEGDSRVPMNDDVPATFDDGSTTKTVDGVGTYTVAADGTVTFVPEKSFVGTAPAVTVVREDKNGTKASATYTPTVTPVTPTATPAESTGPQGLVQTGTVTFTEGDEVAPINKDSITLLDENGQPASSVDAKSPAGDVIGTFTVDKETGVVTFTPTDKSYSGDVVPVKVQAADTNGTTVETTYTPKITPVVPTSEDATTTDIQGATQTGKPVFTEGDSRVPMNDDVPATFDDGSTTKSVDGVGTYTVATDGTVTFVPEPSFTGTAPAVTVVREDKNGTKASATYTPSVTPITVTPTDKVSADIQNVPQTQTPTFDLSNDKTAEITSKKLVDPATGQPTDETTVTVAGEGSYTIDPTTGAVTFTPEKDFVGTAKGVTVQATATITNANGKTATITSDATYTPTVVPAVPTANPATSKDIQGATQTGTPTFAGTTVQVNGEDKAITIKDNSYTLLDNDGNEVTSTPAYAADGTTEIGTYSIDSATGQVTFTPTDKSYTGVVTPAKVQAESSNGIKVDTTYTPEIVPVTPTATPAETKDIQGATQTGKPEFKGGTVTVDGVEKTVAINEDVPATFDDGSTTKTVDGVGTYTVAADGTVTFVPEKSFVGTAPAVTVVREDKNGTKASATYTPTVTPVTPTATPVETTDIQGATQTGKPVFTEGDSRVPMNDDVPATFDDGSTTKSVDGVGTYTVATDGTVTFVPEPSFTGTAPAVTVVREDKNGTKASATYTPSVTPITVTPTDKVSADIQNVPQTQTPTFDLSNDKTAEITSKKLVDPATGQPTDETTVTVAGEGSYTIDPTTGAVTFTPEKDFVGTAKGVTVQATATITNANGKTATITSDATYTPTVVPAVPTANPATSKDIQGATQTGTPTFAGTTVQVNGEDKAITIKDNSYTLLDNDGNEVTSTPAYAADGTTEIGTYSIDSATGQVTFTPTDKSYTGVVTPAKVQAESSNGIKVDTTYTPEIVPVTPTATPAETKDIQGATQTGKPEFKGGTVTVDGVEKTVAINEDVPATFDDGSTTKTVDGVGTYTVAADGTVTFVPEKSFVGTAPAVTVVREDKNGTKASATYTPTVTPVTPTATPVETTDIQGATQTGKPVFTEGDSRVPMNDDVPATFDDGSTTKTIDGVGTYTVAADGTVTFVPEKSFVGTAPAVTVVREDKNGTKASATYTPTVTPVTPTAEDTTSTDKQGQTQTGTPTFTPGNPNVPMDDDTPATFEDGSTTKTVPGEGTYTVAPDGTVTFVPEKSFTGEGTGVTVKRVDKNGTPVTAKYTPTVTPVTPTATPAESEAPQGVVQTGTVTFTEGDPVAPIDKDTITLLDENGQPVASVEAKSPAGDVIGTFTVDKETGVVTFTPTDKSYSGDVVPVKVQAADTNGTTVETTYTPKITPVVPTAELATSTDIQGKTQTGTPSFTPGNPAIPMDDDVPATFEDGSTTKVIPGEGTYTVVPDGTVTFVPEKAFTGEGTGVTVKRVDKNGTPATAKYTPTVTPVTPTAEDTTSTGKQGQTQTGKPEFTEGDSRVPMNDDVPATFDDGSTTKTVDGVGTYTVAADGTVTFVPEKSFTGKAPAVTVVREDKNGTKASATYTPTVTPVTPTATPAESTGPQGVVQTGTVTFTEGDSVAPIDKDTITLLDENGQPAAAVFAKSPAGDIIGTFTVDKETGVVTFTPTDKSYSGDVVPVKVQAADTNGTTVETTYTPNITPVVPTSEDATSTDIQGQTQSGKPTFTEGNPNVPIDEDTPATFEDGSTTKTVEGVGTYTVAADGTVTFVPEKSFTGTATGVTVKRVDKNGTEITAKYTPTVTPVTPTATPTTSTDIQGATQTGKPVFTEGDSRVPMNDDVPATFEDGSTTKTVDGVGTYTVVADGTVTFVPEKSFVGTAPAVTVVREDKNGTKASATYTPTVTPVTPTAEPTTSTDIQGATQTGKPVFTEGDSRVPMNDDVPATFEDGSTTKTVDGVGTYTVVADGTVTFVPEKSFVGTAPAVTVVREDKNGTKASATYTPTVTPVTPTSEPATSTDIQGQTQTGKPRFTPGNPSVPMDDDVPATFEDGSTTKVIPGEGTYTVAPDGTVTFVPEKAFTGTGTGVTVKRVDKNGTAIPATYTPTVTPVTPTAESVTSIGNKGQTQTGKPVFTEGDSRVPMNNQVPATFEDGSTTKTIAGVGTYTVAADGTVTFTPETEFTGTAPAVTVVREDVNGTKASATYTPTVLPITKFVDKEGKEIPGYPTVDGEQPKAEIPGYRFVETKKLPNGDIEHVYEKVTTSYVDENGTPIPGYPTEDGQQPKKEIPGYEFVKTIVDENGNTQHIYKQIVTPTPVPDTTPTPEPQPAPQTEEPKAPVLPETKEEAHFINPSDKTAQLPETGSEDSNLAIFGLASLLAGFGLYGAKRRKR